MEQAAPIDVTHQETQEEVRARKMAQIEQYKQEQAQKQVEKVDTSYPASEIPNYSEEPSEEAVQGELLDY
jgi:hypothetical protein